MQSFLLGVWREEEGHLKQLKRMLSCLDSLTSSPYSLFSSVVSNPPRVSHRGVLGLPVWPCFAQALDLEELSARQDRVSRRTSQRICRANGLWGSEAVAEILP